MDFRSYLQANAQKVDEEIDEILSDWLRGIKKDYPKLIPLVLAFINACKGGKRIRGMLVRLGYEIAGGVILEGAQRPIGSENGKDSIVSLQNDIIRIGAALEILHASILAHDDIFDQSHSRRGQKTLYKALGGDHYSISQTIALADVGFFICINIIVKSSFLDTERNRAIEIVSQMMVNTGLGEVLDMELPHLRVKGQEESIKEEDVFKIMHLKTAQYTISGPLMIGATLGGVGKDLLGKLAQFGQELGMGFQIQDDILGVFGEEEEIGKSVTSDIEEGKNTLLITQALKKADKKQKDILDKYYGKGRIGMDELEKVRKVFRDTGALDYSRQTGVKYVNQAKKYIPEITKDKRLSGILYEMADFLVERNK